MSLGVLGQRVEIMLNSRSSLAVCVCSLGRCVCVGFGSVFMVGLMDFSHHQSCLDSLSVSLLKP